MRALGGLLLFGLLVDCASTVDRDPVPVDAATAGAHPITEAEITRACLLVTGCGTAPVGSVGRCVRSLTRRALDPRNTQEDLPDRVLECAAQPATSTTCAAFVDCVSRGHLESYCAAHSNDSCDGAIAVHCSGAGAPASAEDCGAIPGGRCVPYGGNPTLALCEGPCRPVCATSGAVVLCNGLPGQRANRCTTGTSCVAGTFFTNPVGACLAPGPSCAALDARCEGDTLVRCGGSFNLLRETRSDCARLGWRCTVGDEGATCVPPPFACAIDAPPSCEGDTLVACAAGSNPRFDCRALGFARCAPASKGRPARCELPPSA